MLFGTVIVGRETESAWGRGAREEERFRRFGSTAQQSLKTDRQITHNHSWSTLPTYFFQLKLNELLVVVVTKNVYLWTMSPVLVVNYPSCWWKARLSVWLAEWRLRDDGGHSRRLAEAVLLLQSRQSKGLNCPHLNIIISITSRCSY